MIQELITLISNNPVIVLILLTFIPALELRASIPYGIFNTDIHWFLVAVICITTNIILGPIIYVLIDKFIHLFLKIKIIDKLYNKWVERTQRKIQKTVDKYGELGVALFIGVPLPGSGSYSGALGSYLIGLPLRKFIVANIIGNLIAGTAVTIISLSGIEALNFFIKT